MLGSRPCNSSDAFIPSRNITPLSNPAASHSREMHRRMIQLLPTGNDYNKIQASGAKIEKVNLEHWIEDIWHILQWWDLWPLKCTFHENPLLKLDMEHAFCRNHLQLYSFCPSPFSNLHSVNAPSAISSIKSLHISYLLHEIDVY